MTPVQRNTCHALLIFTSCWTLAVSVSCTVEETKWTWFLNDDVYYILYDDAVSLEEARCACDSLPDARLAIFDHQVSFDGVGDFLSLYHSEDQFWVDAERDANLEGNYTWANGCLLPIQTPAWTYYEPSAGDYRVRIRYHYGSWKFFGTRGGVFRPLCQSARAPFNYLPTPPTLTWVSLGALGHMFAFSNEERSLEDARAACEQQAGKVYLATLDTLYDEVAQYILDNHSERTYWLDAVTTPALEWATGGAVDSSRLLSGSVTGVSTSVAILKHNGDMKLRQTTGAVPRYYVCEGSPAPEATASSTPAPLTWISLGSPRREFGFSGDKVTFMEARDVCRAQPGKVRLAVLDTLFTEVARWVKNNHPEREYWVDATRPKHTSVDFLWSDGKGVDASVWKSGDPDSNDWAARLDRVGSAIVLSGTSYYPANKYYICEHVPEVTLEWRLLGSPGKLFGFSRTPSWGFDWAKDACSRQPGDVTLANLDTHFDDVAQFVENKYPERQYWVDATRVGGGTFQWGNGLAVDNTMWHSGEPTRGQNAASMEVGAGGVALSGHHTVDSLYFVCQGRPATHLGDTEVPPPCREDPTTMGPTSTSPIEETTPLGEETTTLGEEITQLGEETTTLGEETTPLDEETTTLGEETTPLGEETTTLSEEATSLGEVATSAAEASVSCVSNCSCRVRTPTFSINNGELEQLLQTIRRNLTLEKSSLSATIRKKTSAEDHRPSTQAAGGLAVTVLVLVLVLIVFPDIVSVAYAIMGKVSTVEAGNNRK